MMLSEDPKAVWARKRRTERTELGLCLNGKAKATHGRRCYRCCLVHRHGVEVAKAMPVYWAAPKCGPGLRVAHFIQSYSKRGRTV